MTIDLAPNHKLGLIVENPILLGAGAIGYGEAVPKGLNLAQLGAAVIGPMRSGSRGGTPPPRLAHVNGGIVLEQGGQNRGVSAILQRFARLWPQLGCPVIAQVSDRQPAQLRQVAMRLGAAPGIAGFELLAGDDATPEHLATQLRVLLQQSDLPIWVKLPSARALDLAQVAVEAGAVGLVVGAPQPGAGVATDAAGRGTLVEGELLGPLAFGATLRGVAQVARLKLPCALIAAGGLHTLEQVRQALAAGAQAVQIDSALWVEPGLANRLAAEVISPARAL
jgi:dihydroorotate dehydrogenase (NAD+) catalytic subunit